MMKYNSFQTVNLHNRVRNVIGNDAFEILFMDRTTKGYLKMVGDKSGCGRILLPSSELEQPLTIPRSCKKVVVKRQRQNQKGEVFTPASICNHQLEIYDKGWFGYEEAFFREKSDFTFGPVEGRIRCPRGKDWKSYVAQMCLEYTCGEGPYTVNRHNVTSSMYEIIPLAKRCGTFDRKMRMVVENTDSIEDWYRGVALALQSTYAFDYQADSVLLTRESLIMTVADNLVFKFGLEASLSQDQWREIAEIISWNVWQMDALTFALPYDNGTPCKIKYWVKNAEILVEDIYTMSQAK